MVTLYEVGGCVRDQLLGIPSKDIDFAVEAPSFDVMRAYLLANGFEIFLETPEYFTIRARFPRDWTEFGTHVFEKPRGGQKFAPTADFVLCRKESTYSDGRRPDSVEMGTIFDDLARRDFTVNAIALADNGAYYDPHHGMTDLRTMTLRCVGSAEDRLREDALRALRALRFRVTKDFIWDDELFEAMSSEWLPPLLANVSQERIREELHKTFQVDTLVTLDILMHELSPALIEAMFHDGLWLKPTNEG